MSNSSRRRSPNARYTAISARRNSDMSENICRTHDPDREPAPAQRPRRQRGPRIDGKFRASRRALPPPPRARSMRAAKQPQRPRFPTRNQPSIAPGGRLVRPDRVWPARQIRYGRPDQRRLRERWVRCLGAASRGCLIQARVLRLVRRRIRALTGGTHPGSHTRIMSPVTSQRSNTPLAPRRHGRCGRPHRGIDRGPRAEGCMDSLGAAVASRFRTSPTPGVRQRKDDRGACP